ncbi:HNH endonuclease [Shewanella maritima]|uniref:HNH endonuclease n=1 Tax=Shewanella maritima TaxID=2520507 RepID=A0A411PM91_9GAMM|nr:HNH endonuclease [Shewanella maritima]QBF84660.1 HNH endonuclease [Shewanella maritima]
MKGKQLITLKSKFDKYFKIDPESPSGLSWKCKSSKRSSYAAGDKAGTITTNGYYTVVLFGRHYRVHRIVAVLAGIPDAHLLRKGCQKYQIDHINRERTANCPSNLRVVTPSVNNQNRAQPERKHDAGIRKRGKTFTAYYYEGNKQVTVGTFDTREEAVQARAGCLAA